MFVLILELFVPLSGLGTVFGAMLIGGKGIK